MPRYFFDIHDGIDACDIEGSEWPDRTAAQANAMQVAAAYAGKPSMVGEDGGAIVVNVRDDDRCVLTVRLVFSVRAC